VARRFWPATGGWEVVFGVRRFFLLSRHKTAKGRQTKKDLPQNNMRFLDISAKMRTFASSLRKNV
jgi:hypothetical protein